LLQFLVVLGDRSPWWSVQTSGLDTNLRGVSIKYDQGSRVKQHYFVWAAGSNGVILPFALYSPFGGCGLKLASRKHVVQPEARCRIYTRA
jgi:hypothetical protein